MKDVLPTEPQVLGGPVQPGIDRHGAAVAPTDVVDLHAQFVKMSNAFAHHGGMIGPDEVVRGMRGRVDQPISVLARRIVSREVISIEWQSTMHLPVFQFTENTMDPTSACRDIVGELSDVMDDWTIALWFATCNPLLDGVPPVEMLSPYGEMALLAARAARQVCAPRGGCSIRR